MTAVISWMDRAACAGVDPERFFPRKTGNGARVEARAAQSICAGCPVIAECTTHADGVGAKYGVWGGRLRSADQRRERSRWHRCPVCHHRVSRTDGDLIAKHLDTVRVTCLTSGIPFVLAEVMTS